MIVTTTSIFVDDQQKALEFYTTKLGFQLKNDVPLGADAAGQALIGTPVDGAAIEQAAAAAVAITDPASDLRGPAEFRKHVAGVMVRRAIARARERVGG